MLGSYEKREQDRDYLIATIHRIFWLEDKVSFKLCVVSSAKLFGSGMIWEWKSQVAAWLGFIRGYAVILFLK